MFVRYAVSTRGKEKNRGKMSVIRYPIGSILYLRKMKKERGKWRNWEKQSNKL